MDLGKKGGGGGETRGRGDRGNIGWGINSVKRIKNETEILFIYQIWFTKVSLFYVPSLVLVSNHWQLYSGCLAKSNIAELSRTLDVCHNDSLILVNPTYYGFL